MTRKGIRRLPRPRNASTLPLNDRQQQVLDTIESGEHSPVKIAVPLGLTRNQIVSTLYALQDRGLIRRVPHKGWWRT